MEIPSLLPRVNFLGAARKRGLKSDVEKLKREDIQSGEQLREFLKDGKSSRAMYFGTTAVSRKAAEVKSERETKHILYSLKDSNGDRVFRSDMWSEGSADSYVDEFRLIDPRDAFFKSRPSLSPDEYVVAVGVGFNPW